MKKNGRILMAGLVALVMAVAMLPAMADVGTENVGITNSIVNNATTSANVGRAIKIDKQDNVGLLFKFQGTAAGTDAITITFARSVDGTTWETTPRFTWATALNGTTAVVTYTNLNSSLIGAAGYLKVISIQNASATVLGTNASLTVIKKTLKPSP
jgi:hypothetical protein